MTNSPNPHYISQNANGSSMTQPVDTVDFPHSGLIKALNQMAAGNVVLKTGADFDINQTGGNLVVAAGKILRNGKYHEVATKTFADSSLTTTYDKGYHLLVVADGREGGETVDVLYLRPPTAANRVPEFKLGDTIVAMIEYSTATSAGSRLIQFFTTNKESNSLSIAYANSNVYTEAGSIVGASTGTTVTSIGTLTLDSDDTKITASANGKPTLTLENTASVASAASEPQIIFDRTGTSDSGTSGDLGQIIFRGLESGGATQTYVALHAEALDETHPQEDGRIRLTIARNGSDGLTAGTSEFLRISGTEGVIFNHEKIDINFAIMGDTNDNVFYVDGNQEKIGIGHAVTTTNDATLDIVTGGTFRNTRLLTVSVSASTTLTEAAHAGRYNICAGNITLPATSSAGEHYAILNTTGGDITIGRNGNNINGAGSDFTLGTFKAATCIAIGSNNWMIVG